MLLSGAEVFRLVVGAEVGLSCSDSRSRDFPDWKPYRQGDVHVEEGVHVVGHVAVAAVVVVERVAVIPLASKAMVSERKSVLIYISLYLESGASELVERGLTRVSEQQLRRLNMRRRT